MRTISNITLIGRGILIVNLPILIIMLFIWFGLISVSAEMRGPGLIIATAVGWVYWAYVIKIWVRWAHENGASEEQIFKAGKRSLLLWKRDTVTNALGIK